jgi:hypothetical protein
MWLTIIMLILQYGPAIWKLVKEIIDMINGVSGYMSPMEAREFRREQRAELKNAVAYYKLTKDKCKLEAMHGQLTCQLNNFKNQ